MLKLLLLHLLIALISFSSPSYANKSVIKVGGYLFPPFVQLKGQKVSGLTPDLIELFNNQQNEFIFTFTPTSPKRRYSDFDRGLFDVIFFENKQWSWETYPIEASKVFLSGGEVFFAKQQAGRDQSFFNKINDKSIAAILGYHYAFLDNKTDTLDIKKRFDIKFLNSPKTVINLVVNGKSQLGIATYSYLQQQIKNNPLLGSQILTSNSYDQVYQHQILVRRNHAITPTKINSLLDKAQNNGTLLKLLAKYGLTPLPLK